ncbi:hypothetical protein ZWY2020_022617 [Hordeum vulgare]|nr:hypothetical protein ZWY2020_022617 [Hordeum vulgare]
MDRGSAALPRHRVYYPGVTPANHPVASPRPVGYKTSAPARRPPSSLSSLLLYPVTPLFLSPDPLDTTMAHYTGGSSSAGGGAPESNWSLSLDSPTTEEFPRYELLVSPGCRLAKPWKVSKDGYATMPPRPATAEELRTHRGGRHNIRGRHTFWDGKNYNDVIAHHRRTSAAAGNPDGIERRPRGQAAIPQPPPAAPPMVLSSHK